ncbi:MAG TPA: hypothetical protein EYQ69_09200 [Gemmatimonadetes bacterium]|jgi:ribonuclease D|nr:hypothetical protein [Gemmatimonadota bacterium]
MSVQLIDNQEDTWHLSKALSEQDRFAIDLEAAGFHRYSDQVCLLQITSGDKTFLVDTLLVDPTDTLRPLFQSPNILLVLHGGAFDLRLLHRDLQIFPVNLFDTQIAASLVGEPSLGLAALLNKYLGIELSKKYQKADWASRPLSDEMLEYATADTQNLCLLSDLLIEKLRDLDRLSWATEESRALADLRWNPEPNLDPVLRIKGSKHLLDREIERLRTACNWRDTIARKTDRAHFRVAGDPVLLEIAKLGSYGLSSISKVKGMSSKVLKKFGKNLLNDLERIDSLPANQLTGYPIRTSPRRPRLSLKEEKTLDELKLIRNQMANQFKIARGSIMSNALLSHIATSRINGPDDLLRIKGVRKWHIQNFGDDILEVLRNNSSV